MKRKNIKFMAILLIFAMMLTGCSTVEKTGVNNEINAVELEGEKLTEGESTSSESTESVSEETSSNVTESVSTESEVVDDNNSEETKEEFTESATTETEEVTEEIVASGFLEDADIEWKIVGTTLYVSGEGAIPDFPNTMKQARKAEWVLEDIRDWQFYDELVEKIVIEDGITKIGKNNFGYFEKVTEIIIPDSVTEVAIWGCNGLGISSIDFNNITKLGLQAFGNLKNLKSVTIPGSIEKIPESMFWFCNNLTEIHLEEGVKEVGHMAFCKVGPNCHIYLPESLEVLDVVAAESDAIYHVKAGSKAEQLVKEHYYQETLTIIVE